MPTASIHTYWCLYPAVATAALAPAYALYLLVPGALAYVVLTGRLPRLTAVGVLALALTCWATVTQIWTADPVASVAALRLLVTSVILFLLTVSDIVRTGSCLTPLRVLAASGPVVAVVYLSYARPVPAGPTAVLINDLSRNSLSFVDVNYSAYAIALSFAATVALVSIEQWRRPPLGLPIWCLAMAVEVAALVRADTRGAYVSAILAVAAALIAIRWARATLTAGVLVTVLIAVLSLSATLARFTEATDITGVFAGPDRGLSGRELIWISAQQALEYRPLTGNGIDGYQYLLWTDLYAHNLFLATALGLGLIGVTIYGAILLTTFWPIGGRGLADRHDRVASARVRAIVLAASIPIWSTGVWEWSMVNWTALGVCAGVAAWSHRAEQAKPGVQGRRTRANQPTRRTTKSSHPMTESTTLRVAPADTQP